MYYGLVLGKFGKILLSRDKSALADWDVMIGFGFGFCCGFVD